MGLVLPPTWDIYGGANVASNDTIVEAYCECEVFGAANGYGHLTTRDGRIYQVFFIREVCVVTKVSKESAFYGENTAVRARKKAVDTLIQSVKNARAYTDYAIAMPEKMVIREGEKTVEISKADFRRLYQLTT